MMTRMTTALFTLMFALTMFAGTALAISPQQKLMAKRAAELDAYRQLAERVMGMQIESRTTVQDFVTESDDIAAALDTFIKGVRITAVRYYDDGSAEVDAELTIQQVITELKRIRDEVYRGGRWQEQDFEEIRRRTHHKVISVTGAGAARAQSHVADPADTPIVQPMTRSTRTRTVDLPPIYRDYPAAERLKAQRAAQLDAYRKLFERIRGLEISSESTVRDFVTESDVIASRMNGQIKGARVTDVRYNPDGVVEVEMQMTIEQVVTTLKRVKDEVFRDGQWTDRDFEQISRRTNRKLITVLGTGALDTRADADWGDGDFNQIIDTEQTIIVE